MTSKQNSATADAMARKIISSPLLTLSSQVRHITRVTTRERQLRQQRGRGRRVTCVAVCSYVSLLQLQRSPSHQPPLSDSPCSVLLIVCCCYFYCCHTHSSSFAPSPLPRHPLRHPPSLLLVCVQLEQFPLHIPLAFLISRAPFSPPLLSPSLSSHGVVGGEIQTSESH
jgi:hypothetical protein